MIVAVQFLQNHPEVSPSEAGDFLRRAYQRLPFSYLLLGWNLPTALETACAEEAAHLRVRLFRWQPLLSGDGLFEPRPAWRVVGLAGERVQGYLDDDEFTFICPNHPEARKAVLGYVDSLLTNPRYQGLFFDRIRFPSPTGNLPVDLGCFCEHCVRSAALEGLDLMRVRRELASLLSSLEGTRRLLDLLLAGPPRPTQEPALLQISCWLDFRSNSITRLVAEVAGRAHACGAQVGLDCFSPCLTRLVGQNLPALEGHADWIKVMTYAHTLGPAGLPFEFLALAGWLVQAWKLSDMEAMQWLCGASGLALPSTRAALADAGVPPQVIEVETRRGRSLTGKTLFSGAALVEVPGINRVEPAEVASEMAAYRRGGADGLVISWDLWELPLERLDQVREALQER